MINVDFVDVRIVMENKGIVLMGIGMVSGENCVIEVVRKVIYFKLLEVFIDGVIDVIVNIFFRVEVILFEIEVVLIEIRNVIEFDLNVIYGYIVSVDLEDEMIVIIVVIGYEFCVKGNEVEKIVGDIFRNNSI